MSFIYFALVHWITFHHCEGYFWRRWINPTVPFQVLNFLAMCAYMWHNWNYSIFILMILKYGVYMLNRNNYCMSHAPTSLHAMTWSQLWDKNQCQVRANMIITQDFIKICVLKVYHVWLINKWSYRPIVWPVVCINLYFFWESKVTVSPQKMTWYQL